MDAAMYKALSGAVVQMRRLDTAAQDLANVNTSGYKGQRLAFAELIAGRSRFGERSGGLVGVGEQRINFSQGEVQPTGNPFHFAIEGEGFFAIATTRGERYTRHGTFTLSSDGTVITPLGEALLGEAGPIRVSGSKMEVTPDGTVTSEQGEAGKIRVVRFADPRALVREGQGQFHAPNGGATPASRFGVLQGSLEQANVNPIELMVTMITIQRQFEAYERAMRLMDTAIGKMLSEGARL